MSYAIGDLPAGLVEWSRVAANTSMLELTMLETHKAILHGNQLEWTGSPPAKLDATTPVPVHVTILEPIPDQRPEAVSRGEQMADALRELAKIKPMAEVTDPAAWEREIRQDRALPGRDP
ncbi:MAG TPA: hypothetical protein VND64_11520 [Pirellulales bacterium]|nr:hypothetical protein [Pirellulales bacterium]